VHRFGQEGQDLGPVVVCAGNTSAAQPWRWHNADNMHTTKGQKQGDSKRGECTRRGSVLTRLLAQERQGLRSTVVCSACGCRRQTGARRHTSNRGTTQLQGKGARAVTTAAAPASDRLGSMAGSQATAGLRGGAVRVSGPRMTQMKPRAWPSFLCSARRPSSTAGREMRRSPRVQGCGGEAVLKSPGGDGCRTGDGGGLV
jgi:hypothetical protein